MNQIVKHPAQLLALVFLLVASCSQRPVSVLPGDAGLQYQGRVAFHENDQATFFWPGTSVKISFTGTSLKALLEDEKGDNYYNVIIDEDSLYILYMDTLKHWYNLVRDLPPGDHTLELFKRTEFTNGKTKFYGFQLDPGAKIKFLPGKKRVIEFFGNSITCGYGIEDFSGQDRPDSIFTNNYETYAACVARHFNARYYCTARSGIGIIISWFPQIMPELWYRLDPMDPISTWDFTKDPPDIVVVNLLQNDSWLVERPGKPEYENRFGREKPSPAFIINSYYNFINKIRMVYPGAHVICALGSMDATREGSPWPGYIENAVDRFADPKMHTIFFPYKDTPGHPRVKEQAVMADSLIGYIEKNIKW